MKRFLSMALMVMVLLSSCTKEDVLEKNKNIAITFDNAFVDNPTRAQIDNSNLKEFSVWGYKNQVGGLFWSNEKVSKASGKWEYQNLAYWEENNKYYIHALAPYNKNYEFSAVTANDGTIQAQLNYSSDFETDLVYAPHARTIEEDEFEKSTPEAIDLTFKHLLSRVRIQVVNELSNKHSRVLVTRLISGRFIQNGTVNLSVDGSFEWKLGTDQHVKNIVKSGEEITIYHKDFGINSETTYAYTTEPLYVLPQTLKANSAFCEIGLQQSYYTEKGISNTVSTWLGDDFTLEPGKSYQFTIIVTDDVFYDSNYIIRFEEIDVEDWDDYTEQVITPISFASPAVTKSTLDLSTEAIDQFFVSAYLNNKPEAVVLNEECVTKDAATNTWNYDNTAYWISNKTFHFTAVAPYNFYEPPTASTPGEIFFVNGHSSNWAAIDLVYAEATVNVTDDFIANPEPVSFQFKHLLSKVKITYKNNITNNNYKVSVSNTRLTIKTCAALIETPITDNSKWVPYLNGDRGEYSSSAGIPFSTLYSETVVPNGGSVSTADHRYVIPLENSQDEISFTLTIQEGQSAPVRTQQNIQLNWSPKMGGNYNVVININEDSVTQSISKE